MPSRLATARLFSLRFLSIGLMTGFGWGVVNSVELRPDHSVSPSEEVLQLALDSASISASSEDSFERHQERY